MTNKEVYKLAEDPNYQAFEKMEKSGKFDGYKPGTWIAILNGLVFASNIDKNKLSKIISRETDETDESCFIEQVNIEKKDI